MPAAASSARQIQRRGDAVDRGLRRRAVERTLAAHEGGRIEIAEHDIGVGDGRGRRRHCRSRPDPGSSPRFPARPAACGCHRRWQSNRRRPRCSQCRGCAARCAGPRACRRPTARPVRPRSAKCRCEVPPMSNGTRSGMPSRSAQRRPPDMPPAGPDSTVPAASREASSTGAMPPCDSTTNRLPLSPASVKALREIGEIAPHDRFDIGVHDRGRDPLIFLDLRQHVARSRHADAGQFLVPAVRPRRVHGPD